MQKTAFSWCRDFAECRAISLFLYGSLRTVFITSGALETNLKFLDLHGCPGGGGGRSMQPTRTVVISFLAASLASTCGYEIQSGKVTNIVLSISITENERNRGRLMSDRGNPLQLGVSSSERLVDFQSEAPRS